MDPKISSQLVSDIFFAFWLAFLTGASLFLLQKYRSIHKTLSEKKIIFPKTHDPDFEAKMAGELRKILAREYMPYKSMAHTTKEIANYTSGDHRLVVLKNLEEYEYRGKHMSREMREQIISDIKKKK
jgi:hypothetical protein